MTKKMKKLEFNPGFYNRIKFGHNPFVANNERLFAQFVRIFSRTGIQLVLNKQKIKSFEICKRGLSMDLPETFLINEIKSNFKEKKGILSS